MSNIEFELISPDRLRETGQADWRLCFTCQIVKNKKKEKLQDPFPQKGRLIIVFFYNISQLLTF